MAARVAGKYIQAAGGIVVRGTKRALFAVVQRSKDDHWVLPRGKLKRDENPITGARREVVEETGHRVEVNEFLGAITYRAGGRPKVVQFWQMQAEDEASHKLMADIVAVEWLPLKAAVRRLSYPLEKLFLRNVGRRAAKQRKGRKLPRRIALKTASKADKAAAKRTGRKSARKVAKKASKKAGKRALHKLKTRHKAKTRHKGTTKKRARSRARKSAAHRVKTVAHASKPKPQRHSTPDRAPSTVAASSAIRPIVVPAQKPAANPASAAERKGILQRVLGRLGG